LTYQGVNSLDGVTQGGLPSTSDATGELYQIYIIKRSKVRVPGYAETT